MIRPLFTLAMLLVVGCAKQTGVAPARVEANDAKPQPASMKKERAVKLAMDEVDAPATLRVTSLSFSHNSPIPVTYSAYGEDASPPLTFGNVPEGTRSLVVIVDDPDAKEPKPFVHWVLWNVPAEVTNLRTAVPATGQVRQLMNAKQGPNSRGSTGYFGPKPPINDPPHHYHFQVFALDAMLPLEQGATKSQVIAAMKGRVLAKGELVGTFQKKMP
jgi:Raf kinase inhibitor-like YbhB/YbcL family protein